MPNCVSLRIQVDNMRGLIGALALMIASNSAIFQPLDPFGRMVDSVTEGDVEVGDLAIIGDVSIGGLVELAFVVFNVVVQASDLFLEVAHFGGSLGFALSDGG